MSAVIRAATDAWSYDKLTQILLQADNFQELLEYLSNKLEDDSFQHIDAIALARIHFTIKLFLRRGSVKLFENHIIEFCQLCKQMIDSINELKSQSNINESLFCSWMWLKTILALENDDIMHLKTKIKENENSIERISNQLNECLFANENMNKNMHFLFPEWSFATVYGSQLWKSQSFINEIDGEKKPISSVFHKNVKFVQFSRPPPPKKWSTNKNVFNIPKMNVDIGHVRKRQKIGSNVNPSMTGNTISQDLMKRKFEFKQMKKKTKVLTFAERRSMAEESIRRKTQKKIQLDQLRMQRLKQNSSNENIFSHEKIENMEEDVLMKNMETKSLKNTSVLQLIPDLMIQSSSNDSDIDLDFKNDELLFIPSHLHHKNDTKKNENNNNTKSMNVDNIPSTVQSSTPTEIKPQSQTQSTEELIANPQPSQILNSKYQKLVEYYAIQAAMKACMGRPQLMEYYTSYYRQYYHSYYMNVQTTQTQNELHASEMVSSDAKPEVNANNNITHEQTEKLLTIERKFDFNLFGIPLHLQHLKFWSPKNCNLLNIQKAKRIVQLLSDSDLSGNNANDIKKEDILLNEAIVEQREEQGFKIIISKNIIFRWFFDTKTWKKLTIKKTKKIKIK